MEVKRRRIRLWKVKKLSITWRTIKNATLSTLKNHHSNLTVRHQVAAIANVKPSTNGAKKRPPLAYLLHLPAFSPADLIDRGNQMSTPAKSPRENISSTWRELHGSSDWDGHLDPLHPSLRREITKYGEFAQATYDAFDFDPLSEFCGSCRYNRRKLFDELHLDRHGYKVTKYIYAMSHVDVPRWLERSQVGQVWSRDSNWMGYVAVSGDDESRRIGRRDIMVAWRGTMTPTEWYNDLKSKMQRLHPENPDVKVQRGFLGVYRSKDKHTRYNKTSASEQVTNEVKRLVKLFRAGGEEVSFTATGHSLGGALAVLSAHEVKTVLPEVTVSAISFGAPRVGNVWFKEETERIGVKTLRVVVKQDVVPKLPGLFMLNKVVPEKVKWVYRHVGREVRLDAAASPYLKKEWDCGGAHNLEVYLHLVDGYVGKKSKFRWNAGRDVALVNKTSDMLKEELRVPEFWYQMPHKGMVFNHKYGRWMKPGREVEDIPSPFGAKSVEIVSCNSLRNSYTITINDVLSDDR